MRNIDKITGKRGQEEIVGFVLIVVLVVIVLVIFLGIRLRNPEPVQRDSEVLYQFLESAMEQTTDCALTATSSFLALDELIRECYSTGNPCAAGGTTCEAVKNTLKTVLNSTWAVGPAYPYKGYEITGVYFVNSSSQQQSEEIFSVSAGNCSNSFTGNSYWIPEFPGSIIVSAKLCSS